LTAKTFCDQWEALLAAGLRPLRRGLEETTVRTRELGIGPIQSRRSTDVLPSFRCDAAAPSRHRRAVATPPCGRDTTSRPRCRHTATTPPHHGRRRAATAARPRSLPRRRRAATTARPRSPPPRRRTVAAQPPRSRRVAVAPPPRRRQPAAPADTRRGAGAYLTAIVASSEGCGVAYAALAAPSASPEAKFIGVSQLRTALLSPAGRALAGTPALAAALRRALLADVLPAAAAAVRPGGGGGAVLAVAMAALFAQ
jgi:hypothetical protein